MHKFLLLIILIAIWCTGCGGENVPVELPEKPARIVVTSASFLEPLHAVGGNMKIYKNFDEVIDILGAEDLTADAVLVSRCGLADEKIITDIKSRRNERLNYLSTILTRRGEGNA